jgi:hypothetical protein
MYSHTRARFYSFSIALSCQACKQRENAYNLILQQLRYLIVKSLSKRKVTMTDQFLRAGKPLNDLSAGSVKFFPVITFTMTTT